MITELTMPRESELLVEPSPSMPGGKWVLQVERLLHTDALACLITPERTTEIPIEGWRWEGATVHLDGADGEFTTTSSLTGAGDRCRWFEATLHVEYRGRTTREAGIQVLFNVAGGGEPTWLVPGAFYRENRLEGCARIYPRYDFNGGDPQALVSNWWAFRADRCATPAIFGWSDRGCAALCTDEYSALGLNGVGFRGDRNGIAIWLNFPYRDEPVTYVGEPVPEPPDCRYHHWHPGERVTIRYRIYGGPPEHTPITHSSARCIIYIRRRMRRTHG